LLLFYASFFCSFSSVSGETTFIFKNGKEYEFRGMACEWQALDAIYSISEIQFKLWNWKSARRFAVVREKIQSKRPAGGEREISRPNQMQLFTKFAGLDGALVLVTGGATGIGSAIVENFVRQGSRVVFLDINEEAGEELMARLRPGTKLNPEFVCADLRDLHSLKGTIESIQRRAGPVKILVNNAANDERCEMEEITPEYWHDRLATNLDHYFFCIQGVAPAMAAAGGGSIVNLGSCVWRLGFPGLPAYATAKAAIEGLTRGLARSLGPRNIRINCVVPGFVRTKRQLERWLTPELERLILDGQCLKRFVEPEDVAALVAFLASDDARSCTNQTFAIDAGWL
jgi:NAD(P)-dependent dehydrogenase (short-subunit alcohol dehydrogenase family)